VETIASDWNAVAAALRPGATVVLDDYYVDPPPALEGFGCQGLIAGLDRAYDVELLDPVDAFRKPWGTLKVCMVRVKTGR
jgi:hypothetical protein